MNRKLLWIVVNTCRLLVSTTFIFSGVVKLIDPVGMQYKVEDYLTALDFTELAASFWTLPLAIAIPFVEFLLGIYLFFGIRRRLTSYSICIFLLLYTPLTLWLAQTNAVADCGCFGDAVHLTNWQTFGKNAVLLVASLVVWWRGQLLTRFISESAQWIVSLYSIFYGLFVTMLCLVGEPIIDFRPYRIGQHIPTAMEWPDDPNQMPEILDFSFMPVDDASHSLPDAEALLADTSYSFLLVAPHLELADDGNMDRINVAYDYSHKHNYTFLGLTASAPEAIHRWQDLTGAEYPFAFMDELTLKTMARSNPALLLLHDGTIVGKWPAGEIPSEKQLEKALGDPSRLHASVASRHHDVMKLLLWYLLPLFCLTFIDRSVFSLKWWRRRHQTAKNNKK